MTSRQIKTLKIYFLIGTVLAFISLFIEWYIFQAVDSSNAVLVDWSYHLFFDWYSPSHLDTELNYWYKPINSSIPLALIIFFIVLLIISSFGALFHSSENISKMKNAKEFAFVNLGVLFLIIFFIGIYPIMYLFPNKLLFPLMIFYDYELKLTFHFVVGLGYYLQIIAFTCCFPYCCYYYKYAHSFEVESGVSSVIKSISFNNEIDLDKLIAEAELNLKLQQHTSKTNNSNEINEAKQIYQDFIALRHRGRKRT
jgi:hypothetical protein